LRDLALTFLHEKAIEGAGDLIVTENMRLRLGLLAALPVLNLDMDWYEGWYAVILYPGAFVPNRVEMDRAGVVRPANRALSGEAWSRGPVILSWEDVETAGRRQGHNVVVHELAHKLDLLNGAANGFPPLHAGMSAAEWSNVFADAYEDFRVRVRDAGTLSIDAYGARSPGEFFAVLSEVFFEDPTVLVSQYPKVYRQLESFYRRSPLARESPCEYR